MSVCLITGGAGNLARQLSWTLSSQYERIILFDVADAPREGVPANAESERGDLLDAKYLDELFSKVKPSAVIHLASLLSGSCEQDRSLGWRVNLDGSFALLETALRHSRPTVLFASSLAAFGGNLPDVLTDETPQWPDSLYGFTKMAVERLGVYYHRRHALDFRCLRLPVTISRHAPSGAVSAMASHAFIEAARNGQFAFLCRPETEFALVYVNDVLRAFAGLLAVPATQLSRRVFNLASMTVTAQEIVESIERWLPDVALRFEPNEMVVKLLASWPVEIDDRAARTDWNWLPEYDLDRTADEFLAQLKWEFSGNLEQAVAR
jgi:threonine 3-dehydrogenase